MIRAHVDDSPYRCPRDGKRLVVEVSQDDEGVTRMWHCCWHCGYEEQDTTWRVPRVRTGISASSAAWQPALPGDIPGEVVPGVDDPLAVPPLNASALRLMEMRLG